MTSTECEHDKGAHGGPVRRWRADLHECLSCYVLGETGCGCGDCDTCRDTARGAGAWMFGCGESRFECACPVGRREFRVRTSSNGATAVVWQCLLCGSAKQISKSSAPPIGTLGAMNRALGGLVSSMVSGWASAEYQAGIDSERRAWFAEHDQYLRTPEWAKRRAKVLERDGGICRGCLVRPAKHVHHLTYDRWKAELACDLISLCVECHEHMHTYRCPSTGDNP